MHPHNRLWKKLPSVLTLELTPRTMRILCFWGKGTWPPYLNFSACLSLGVQELSILEKGLGGPLYPSISFKQVLGIVRQTNKQTNKTLSCICLITGGHSHPYFMALTAILLSFHWAEICLPINFGPLRH